MAAKAADRIMRLRLPRSILRQSWPPRIYRLFVARFFGVLGFASDP